MNFFYFYKIVVAREGKSAQSTVGYKDSTLAFNDQFVATGNPALSDSDWHSLTITVKDGTAYHYMDGQLVMAYILRLQEESFMGTERVSNTSGGFALVVNRMTVEIASLTVTGMTYAEWEKSNWDAPATLYNPTTSLASPPTVSQKVESLDDLSVLKNNTAVAQDAMLYLNEDMTLATQEGISLGVAVNNYINGISQLPHTLTNVYIKDMATALGTGRTIPPLPSLTASRRACLALPTTSPIRRTCSAKAWST